MTLTAILESGRLLNPSASIANGQNEIEVIDFMRRAELKGLFCPHCLALSGEYHPVRFRNAQVRAKHFYHASSGERDRRECSSYSNESEKHMAAVAVIADTLAATSPSEIKVDVQWMISDGTAKRKPDIWVRRNELIEVHEIQISSISLEDLQQRSLDLKQHGASTVTWYLYGGNFNESNRRWAKQNAVQVYHLWFEDSDLVYAKWRFDDAVLRPTKQEPSSRDDCQSGHVKLSKIPAHPDITHIRKPGWVGVIYERPWNMPDVVDIRWVFAPSGQAIPLFPSRYPVSDLRRDGEVFS